MKTNIEITSTVALDEVKKQLVESLSPTKLAQFAVSLGDDMSRCIEYWTELHKQAEKVFKEISDP